MCIWEITVENTVNEMRMLTDLWQNSYKRYKKPITDWFHILQWKLVIGKGTELITGTGTNYTHSASAGSNDKWEWKNVNISVTCMLTKICKVKEIHKTTINGRKYCAQHLQGLYFLTQGKALWWSWTGQYD